MRKLKFRAWNKITQSYEYGRDVFARYNDDELEQFTGLVDRNRTEIYEGDFVCTKICTPGTSENHVIGTVRIGGSETSFRDYDNTWYKPYYGVYLDGLYDCEDLLFDNKLFVIGNIRQSRK